MHVMASCTATIEGRHTAQVSVSRQAHVLAQSAVDQNIKPMLWHVLLVPRGNCMLSLPDQALHAVVWLATVSERQHCCPETNPTGL